MTNWFCTACATLVSGGFPFEEKAVGGVGSRMCLKCGTVRDRSDMHLISTDESCKCVACSPLLSVRMIVCVVCGNKRCPHATHHDNLCTNSNEPDQPESRYGKIDP